MIVGFWDLSERSPHNISPIIAFIMFPVTLSLSKDEESSGKDMVFDAGENFWDLTVPNSPGEQLVVACMNRYQWNRQQSLRVFAAYQQFMTLKVRLEDWRGNKFVAAPSVQQMWETHVQEDLQAYVTFCYHQTGTAHALISFRSGGGTPTDNNYKSMVNQTLVALGLLFNNDYDKSIWNFDREDANNAPTKRTASIAACRSIEKSKTVTKKPMVKANKQRINKKPNGSTKHCYTNNRNETNKAKKQGKDPTLGSQPPHRLSNALSVVVGGRRYLPRPQVTQALWDYIRAHGLQDPNDGRVILCDAAFRAVMNGKSRVTMFNMTKELKVHILERVGRSLYEDDDKLCRGICPKKRR